MSTTALFFTLIFVAFAILLSFWQRIGLEKDIMIGTIRAAVQLIAVGYVLQFIFQLKSWSLIILMLAIMITVATLNARKKGKGLPGVSWRIAVAITSTEILTMGLLVGLKIIQTTPQYIIPISGMIIGNGMVVSGLFFNRLKSEMETRREEINVYLALGATSKQAVSSVMQNTVKASMLPTIDGMKTVGLVQLPGMMTGMIVAGANPIVAVRYQILIMYSFTSAAAITAILLGILTHRLLFTKAHQLIDHL
ncbi:MULTISPECIES: ABC transporter permease [Mesobacillus]|uniref:Membrane protein n=2 Tax=Mesobacillus TaxID=2675231 RepID=A0A0D6Z888_9BACI|nr:MULTISPECIES: iron export ABC transporter permease subunit FetB [Mesobacillus]KIY21752.1 membrane protein [Mesobacillus subterraneus]MDQ0412304.1 putative ABC transport system permease protein [Mesobacillus stamsii]